MVNQRKHYPVKRRSRASLIVLIVLALLLMIAAVILAISLPEENNWPQETEPVFTQPVLDTGFDADSSQVQNIYPLGQGVVRISQNQVAYLNIQGNEIFAAESEMSAPFCVKAGEYLLVADRDGHAYIMLTEEGILYKGNLTGRIAGAAVRADGYMALIEDQTDGHGIVRMFEPETGLKLYDCYFPESGYVLSVSFSPYEDYFDVAIVNTDGASIQPVFKRYSIEGLEQGQLLPDTVNVLPIVAYDSDGVMTAGGVSELYGFSYNQDLPLYQETFHQIKMIQGYQGGLVIIANQRYGGKWEVFTRDSRGNLSAGIELGESVTPFAIKNSKMVIGAGTSMMVIDLDKNEVLFDQNLAVEIVRADFVSDELLTVVTKTGIRRLNLKME